MKTKWYLILALSLVTACERKAPPPPPAAMEMQERCAMERREKMQKMADLCASRGAAVHETLQEVLAAQSGKNMKQMKLALGKAADELRRMEEHLTMCRERLEKPMPGPCPCMRHPGEEKCGHHMEMEDRI